jgi:PKD repeat protein
MIRTRCAAVIGTVAASLVLATAAPAPATPATPSIAIQQPSSLKMRLTSSTGTHWSWTVRNAAGATVATATTNPAVVTFPAAGDYRAVLDATDDDPVATAPAHAEATFHVYAPPVAAFTNTQQPGNLFQFADTSTGEPTAWTWTFPGATFKGRAPPARVLPAGTSTVSLKVTNPAGSDTITRTIVVNGPPVARLDVVSSPAAIDSPVLLDASRSTDPDQDPLTYSWDLDGNGVYGDATGPLQSVSYATAGQYHVGVQVGDNHGSATTAVASITVMVDRPPSVTFANAPVAPSIGETVTFTATATDPDGSISHLDWDLDDDGAFDDAAGPAATWSFTVAGRHRVAVRATDDRGVATVAFRSIDIAAPALPNPMDRLLAASAGPSTGSSAPAAAIPNVPASSATRPPLLSPFPVVRIRGLIYRDSVRLSLLKVQAPSGATIHVRCRGHGCAAKKQPDVHVKVARKPVRMRSFEGRSLRAGTTVEVFVTAPHRIGKYVKFEVRRGAAPARSDLCLNPGRTKPTACPTT